MKTTRRSWATTLVLVPLAMLVAVPFYYVLVNTLKTQAETTESPLGLPSELNLDNYVEAFQRLPIAQAFLNTFLVTATSVALMLLVGSLAAFAVILRRSWVTRLVGGLLIVGFLVPFQATLLPLYQNFAELRLVDSLLGLVLLYSMGSIFCYVLILAYMRTIPGELIEAARLDGATSWAIFWRIVLPLIRPILITVGVFQVMWVWNDFIIPNVFISSPDKRTLVLQAYAAVGQFTVDWPMFMTVTVIVLIPMVVFFLVAQRHIVSGLVSGSVKG